MFFYLSNDFAIKFILADQNIQELISGGGIIWGYEDESNNLKYVISNEYNNNIISLIIFLKIIFTL